jgi:hypothetical protein
MWWVILEFYFKVHIYAYSDHNFRPRGLRHELSSPARTLGSWVRIPLKSWMFVCVYSVFVCRYQPCDELITRPRSPTDCLQDEETEVKRRVSRMPYAPEGVTGIWIYVYSFSGYVMLLVILLVWCFVLGSVCGCPECFCWSGSLLFGGQISWSLVVGVSVSSAVLMPRMRGVLCVAIWCSFPVMLWILGYVFVFYICVIPLQDIFADLAHVVFFLCVKVFCFFMCYDIYGICYGLKLCSTVGIVTRDGQGIGVRVPVGTRFFSSPRRPNRLWGPPTSYPMGTGGSFPWGKAAGAWSWPLTSN